MQPGARLAAAIEILQEIMGRGRSASVALADWGKSHRFAGSADRAWIGNLVYDGLRRKLSLAYAMDADTSRAIALAVLRYSWGLPAANIAAMCSGEGFAPAPLSAEEMTALGNVTFSTAPAWVQGDYPEWLDTSFNRCFGQDAVREGRALSERAPTDLRVNALKATKEKVLKAFEQEGAVATLYSPLGVRLPPREAGGRSFKVEANPAHGRGWFEVQDEGSQIAALLSGAGPGMQVADICAGAGGKTLAMAAQMQNRGQIYAYDADPLRFRPIFERLKRAGCRNVQTLLPGQDASLASLAGRMDRVLIDAPCSGSGSWRRRPDAKWRLTPTRLSALVASQEALLAGGAELVKRGGVLAYVTCSVLPEENSDRVGSFLAANPNFSLENMDAGSADLLSHPLPVSASRDVAGYLLTPARHFTDGFYIALLRKTTE